MLSTAGKPNLTGRTPPKTLERRLVSNALTALAGGRTREAATLLLQFVLGVITPVSGAPADDSSPFSQCRERG